MRYPILVLLCLSLTSSNGAGWQRRIRDDWRYVGHGFDLEAHLTHSLQDAVLSENDRNRIYRIIDDKTIHDSYRDDERNEERKVVLSSRLGFVRLAANGSDQMIVRGPQQFCGASGNCSIYIFVLGHDKWQLALQTGGNTFVVEKTMNYGLHNVATYWHMSGEEGGIAVYRFNHKKYEQIDCYYVKFNPQTSYSPVLTDCRSRPGQH